jgi:hypothetical protein
MVSEFRRYATPEGRMCQDIGDTTLRGSPEFVGVFPVALRYVRPHAVYTTLLMSTGLTFGTISSLYGLNAGIIDRTQFSVLVSVVILSAIVPTAVAQRFFSPPRHSLTTAELSDIGDEEYAERSASGVP